MQRSDILFQRACFLSASLILLIMGGITFQLCAHSAEAWQHFGLAFIWSSEWNPAEDIYGAFPHILGTLLSTGIALLIAIPLSFALALFISERSPWAQKLLGQGVDLLAAIPSVIYGMWGLFVLVPLMQDSIQPFLAQTLGLAKIPAGAWLLGEEGWGNGFGFLTAGIILALMILPYMCAVMRDVFNMVPSMLRESAYGLGCTRLEVTRDVVTRYGMRGIMGGIFLGMGRALGETMAVLFVIGNIIETPAGLYSGGTTIAATLANNFAESTGLQQSALFALGLILLGMSFGVQLISRHYLKLTARKRGEA